MRTSIANLLIGISFIGLIWHHPLCLYGLARSSSLSKSNIKSHWLPKQIISVPSIIIVSFCPPFPSTIKNHSRESAYIHSQGDSLLEKQNSEISAYLPFSGTLAKEHRSVSNLDTIQKNEKQAVK